MAALADDPSGERVSVGFRVREVATLAQGTHQLVRSLLADQAGNRENDALSVYRDAVLIQPGSVPPASRGVPEDHLSLQKRGASKTPVEVGSGPRPTTAGEIPQGVQLSGRLGDIVRLVHDEAHRFTDHTCFALVDDERGAVPARFVDGVAPRRRTPHPSPVEGLALASTLSALAKEGAFGFGFQDAAVQLQTSRLRSGVDVLSGRHETDPEVLQGPDPGPERLRGTADAIEAVHYDNVDEALPGGLFKAQHSGARNGRPGHPLVPENELRRKNPPGSAGDVGATRALLHTEPVSPHLLRRRHP